MTAPASIPSTIFVPAGGSPDPAALAQLDTCLADPRARAGALMADHHLGYSMPIGGVVAYAGAISPSGVGYDIACGNKAVLTDIDADDLSPHELGKVMDEIFRRVSFGMGRNSGENVDHPLFEQHAGVLRELDSLHGGRGSLSQKARAQLGTVGSGNHYVDLLVDEQGAVWIANHFGSRGLGHTIANGFLALAAGRGFGEKIGDKDEPTVIDTDTDLGQFYISAMKLAGDYAYAGRDYVANQVLEILGGHEMSYVHNHHNYAWLEDGLWVVRKGATPLSGNLAFIGGSMGEGAAIVRGLLDSPPQAGTLPPDVFDIGALGSAPHGAGRTMSRTKAAGKVKRRKVYQCTDRDCQFSVPAKDYREGKTACPDHPAGRFRRIQTQERVSLGVVDWEGVQADLALRGIVLRGAGADEAPEVYKSLRAVLDAHSNIEIVHWLRPLGVAMAGPDTFDPFRD